jgi:hypothetical protein
LTGHVFYRSRRVQRGPVLPPIDNFWRPAARKAGFDHQARRNTIHRNLRGKRRGQEPVAALPRQTGLCGILGENSRLRGPSHFTVINQTLPQSFNLETSRSVPRLG